MRHSVDRRQFLAAAGGASAMARIGGGGLAGILASAQAPAYAQGTTIHWLRWNDFVPASDQLLRREIAQECQRALGIRLNVETVNANDIQARVTSAVQSGSGPDIFNVLNNWPQLYAQSAADVSDIAEEVAAAQGGFYEVAKAVAHDGRRWLAVPFSIVGNTFAYRKSWFEEVGYAEFPRTWEQFRDAGQKLKAKGRPLGQTLGQTFGDAPTFTYPLMWSFGGKEVEADGRTVVLNSPETIESVRFMTRLWRDACDEGGLAWDDSNNNRAFLSGTISATLNGASIYIESMRRPQSYLTDRGTPMKDDIRHGVMPAGPAGSFHFHLPFSNMMPAYSRNQDATRRFLRWIHSKDVFERWFVTQRGFSVGATTVWEQHPIWNEDPVMLPYRNAARVGRVPGYAGTSNAKAAEIVTKYVITNMYARAVQGIAPEQAVREAHAEVARIYAG
ncbi:extracellular solute-binding protein [Roseomonas hellenica]|nr:extracellular solute-binding protein [Plastoroseomonas hellenica]